jgi:tRNA (mo5U34)-methyltransferase
MLTPEEKSTMESIQWGHKIDLGDGVVTPGYYQHTAAYASSYFGMPDDLSGKTVLDIGCGDGLFSFEAERRGGIVTAIDTSRVQDLCIGKSPDWPRGFQFAKRILGSRVEFREQDLYALDGREQWDVVLFYGVLYHLDRPVEGLARLADATREIALVETAYCENRGEDPVWEFRPGEAGDPTNQWYPSITGLEEALHHVGFRHTECVGRWGAINRATVRAEK